MRLLFILLLGVTFAQAGPIPVIQYNDLEQIIQKKDDTLRVVNFWATWCKPCVEELPYFEKLAEAYKGKPVKVILVSMDFTNKVDLVTAFVQRKNIKSSVLLLNQANQNEWINKIAPDWSGALPATLFVKTSTSIRKFHEGDFTYETLEKQIQQFLTP